MAEAFSYYPEATDPDFDVKLYRKKEFYDTRVASDIYEVLQSPEEQQKYLQERCGSNFFRLQNYQQFVRNYISPATPYRGLLLYHGVGSGKCLLPGALVHIKNNLSLPGESLVAGESLVDGNALVSGNALVDGNALVAGDSLECLNSKVPIETLWDKFHSEEIFFEDDGEWSAPSGILMIYTLDQRTGQMINFPVNRLYRQLINELIRVLELETGQILKLTKKHHLLTENGWSNDFENNHYVSQSNSETSTSIQLIKIIKSYEIVYQGYVYDLEVKIHHNYVADGIICHNTCAAVQIAEGFKEDIVNHGHKVIVITSTQLQSNFQKNLYDFSRESSSTAPGQNQCTSSAYYIPPMPGVSPAKRNDLFDKLQSKYYEYHTYRNFYNEFEIRFGNAPNFKSDNPQEPEEPKEPDESQENTNLNENLNENLIAELIAIYDNTLYIIDEAQLMIAQTEESTSIKKKNVTAKDVESDDELGAEDAEIIKTYTETLKTDKDESEQAQKLYSILLKYILKYCKNIRIVLLTATPMRNTPMDLVKLINLLRMNDYKNENALIKEKVFEMISNADLDNPIDPKKVYNVKYLKSLSIGYVSYVRGENPLTFARKEFADNYQARPIFDYEQKEILMNLNKKDQDRLRQPYYENYSDLVPINVQVKTLMEPMKKSLIECPMSPFQYYYYLMREGQNRNIIILQRTSLIVIPSGKEKNGEFVAKSPASIKDAFNINKDGWSFKMTPLDKMNTKDSIFSPENLKYISSKFSRFLKLLLEPKKSKGTHYVYTYLVGESAKVLGAILEYYGYKPYSDVKKTPNYILAADSRPNKRDQYRCYCGCLYKDHDQCLKDNQLPPHKFKQGTYLFYSSQEAAFNKNAVSVFNTKRNANGELIKVIIGTKAASVGVDYKRIRHMHIMDPWFNSAEIEQTIGRAIRQCAHYDLPVEEQKVIVYHYTATPPEYSVWENIFQNPDPRWTYWKQKFTTLMTTGKNFKADGLKNVNHFPMRETVDELQHRRSYVKERYIEYVKRAIKEISVDCNFNYYYNVYPDDSDFLGTEITEYQAEIFKCQLPLISETGVIGATGVIGETDETGATDAPRVPEHLYQQTYEFEELDLDTFRSNRYFIEPILLEIQNNIMDLYHRNFVLDLKTIEDLIFKPPYQYDIVLNPTLQKEYLHLALSQLVGNSEKAPIEILDQYHRRGYLIFRSPYYVFHPVHIRDSRLPIYYRQQRVVDRPPESITLERAVETKLLVIPKTLGIDEFNNDINVWGNKAIPAINLFKLQHDWDTKNLSDQQVLLEMAIPALSQYPESTYLKALINHFRYQLLVLMVIPGQTTSPAMAFAPEIPQNQIIQWYHGFGKNIMSLDTQTKKWKSPSTEQLNNLFNPQTSLIYKHPYYTRILGQLNKDITISRKQSQREAFITKPLPSIIGFFGAKNPSDKLSFFIINSNKQVTQTKKHSDKTDNRSVLNGINCMSVKGNDLIQNSDFLMEILTQNFPEKLEEFKDNFKSQETDNKLTICNRIEVLLRTIDQLTPTKFYILNQISYDFKRNNRTNTEIIFDQVIGKNLFISGYVEKNTIR